MDWARGLLPRCGAVGTRLAQLTLPNKSTPLTESGTSMARPSPQGTASTSRRCHCAEGAAFVVRAAAQARRHADVNTLVGGTRNPGELPRSSAPRSVRHPSAERAEARKGEGGRIVAHTLQARNPIVPHTQALPTWAQISRQRGGLDGMAGSSCCSVRGTAYCWSGTPFPVPL